MWGFSKELCRVRVGVHDGLWVIDVCVDVCVDVGFKWNLKW